jgi:TetR/AcrR family transcriptional regulator, transcriptional repressor for nem operon
MTVLAATNTRDVILEHAGELLQTVGYSSFSFRTLGERVGIAAASIHYHFPTKADLGLALIAWFQAKMHPAIAELCERNPSIRARFLALGQQIAEQTCVSGKSCPINILLSEFSVLPPDMQHAVRAWIGGIITDLAAWLEQGRSTGELTFPGDATTQARLVWSVIEHGTQLARSDTQQSFMTLFEHLIITMTPSDRTSVRK